MTESVVLPPVMRGVCHGLRARYQQHKYFRQSHHAVGIGGTHDDERNWRGILAAAHMSASDSSPAKVIRRPICTKCGAEMMLARIEPSSPGVDQRTFECKCGHIEMMRVNYE